MMLNYSAMIFLIGYHVAMSQEKVCSSFCSSLGMLESNPGKSCDDIYQINKASRGKSTHYWIQTSSGVHQVYCDMELECGGHKGGWMRIADLDTSMGDDCPTGWSKITTPNSSTFPTKVVCSSPSDNAGCYSASFTVNGSAYHKICGKARGYQRSTPDAFAALAGIRNIDGPYVDGLSITIGTNRKHVWTYAVGVSNGCGNPAPDFNYPCSDFPGALPPTFVRDHYYCESGNVGALQHGPLYTNDPLWDGEGCHDNNDCCTDAALPWFSRQFPAAKQEDVEVRICHDQTVGDEDILVEMLQLFVQ